MHIHCKLKRKKNKTEIVNIPFRIVYIFPFPFVDVPNDDELLFVHDTAGRPHLEMSVYMPSVYVPLKQIYN